MKDERLVIVKYSHPKCSKIGCQNKSTFMVGFGFIGPNSPMQHFCDEHITELATGLIESMKTV